MRWPQAGRIAVDSEAGCDEAVQADSQCLCSRLLVVFPPELAEAALVQVVRCWTDTRSNRLP